MPKGKVWFVQPVTPDKDRLRYIINALGADPFAMQMWSKGIALPLKINNVPCAAANIIKQEALASGIDAAVARGVINCSVDKTDVLILGSVRGIKILAGRLRRQMFALPELADELESIANGGSAGCGTLRMRGRTLSLEKPRVMGILNTTPDSFSDGGSYLTAESIEKRARQIMDEGASFIDVGGVSTRPGFVMPPEDEEMKRVLPAVETAVKIAKEYGGFVSVDTMRTSVARRSLELGADMINDQFALADEGMGEVCAEYNAGVCLMHNPSDYTAESPIKCLDDIVSAFANYVQKASSSGICKENIVLDPGFGFGKTFTDGYCVLHYLSELCNLDYPVLVGVSRKSMIGAALNKPVPERKYGTIALETAAALKGAKIIRTHDVAASVDAMSIVYSISGGSYIAE